MSATYTNTLLTDLNKVRFFIQDTDVANALLQDEEISAMITLYGSYKSASIACCNVLGSKYSGSATKKKIGNLEISMEDVSKKYYDLAKSLKIQFSSTLVPYAGGISVSEKQTQDDNSDKVVPFFKRNMMTDTTEEEEDD
jgi:ABC-type phosphate transport system ATPase subunit